MGRSVAMTGPRRSALYTPADEERLLGKAVDTSADAFIFDLEDAVSGDAKDVARENLRSVVPTLDTDREVAVRVNGPRTDHLDADVAAAVDAGADALVVPMVAARGDVEAARTALTDRTDGRSGDTPSLRLTIETPSGIHNGDAIATACREANVTSLSFGFADYCKALGTVGTPDAVRQRLELRTSEIAAMAGVTPFASVHLDVDDEAGLRRVAERARDLGFAGMTAIHPDQLSVINEAFTPDEGVVAEARRLVEAFDAAERDSLRVDGVFLDTATVDRYRRLLERAGE